MISVNAKGNLEEIPVKDSPLSLWWAKVVSYVLHPAFLPIYVIAFLVYVHPSAFSGFDATDKQKVVLMMSINLVFFPLLAVVLLKALGFISSIFMATQRDRIIPYIACGIFYFWAYTVIRNQEEYPRLLAAFLFGLFLSVSLALIENIYTKVSMHAIGAGGVLGFMIMLALRGDMPMAGYLAASFLLAGLVCTARLALGKHTTAEVYLGLFSGLVCQFLAVSFIA